MVDTPQLVIQDFQGRHNSDLVKSANRLKQARSSVDLSTICIVPTSGIVAARVTENWLGQVSQMNQKFVRLMTSGLGNYSAFNTVINQILANPVLNQFKYVLTLEENTIFPPDGLIKLFESIEKYDVVGGLAFTRGVEGQPMIYGDPRGIFQTFTNVLPFPEAVQECLGVGTGFTLFKLKIFKDKKVPRPWFRTERGNDPGKSAGDVPDMYFFQNIHMLGYKVACDTRVKVGSFDPLNEVVW